MITAFTAGITKANIEWQWAKHSVSSIHQKTVSVQHTMTEVYPSTTWLPPEWAQQWGTLLTWPHPNGDWHDLIAAIDRTYGELAYHISQRQRLLIVCNNESHRHHIESVLEQFQVEQSHCQLYIVPSNDSWARDHGPISVYINDKPCLLDFTFNGWGHKYPADLDNALSSNLQTQGAFDQYQFKSYDFVLEGGAIDCDGKGGVLTTKECLLKPSRNGLLDQRTMEHRLQLYLGVDRILWLEGDYLYWDDTDGHVDTIARFTDANTICYLDGPETNRLKEELRQFTTWDGRHYQLVPLPLPFVKNTKGERLPSSYCNFLIINGAVLVPQYQIPEDAIAIKRLQDCFPTRDIIGIDSLTLIQQYGSIHCATMNLIR